MRLNRVELKKIQYEFNSMSNRLLQADFRDYSAVLSMYVAFLTENELIHEFILDCGNCDQDMEQEFAEVRSHRAVFALGNTVKEEVRNVYAILKYTVENNFDVSHGIGMSYSHSNKYQEILKDFNNRVTMVLIRHIETYLTKAGIDMGLDDSISYNITVKDGQVIIANDNAVVNAANTVNAVNKDELVKLINEIKVAAENSNLSSDDEETVNNSLEVIEDEITKEKPRKGFIKTAIAGLKVIKGTAEFGAAIATLIKFIQPFIG